MGRSTPCASAVSRLNALGNLRTISPSLMGKSAQSANALSLRPLTCSGNSAPLNDAQLRNAFSPTVSKTGPKSMLSSLAQLLKARLAIFFSGRPAKLRSSPQSPKPSRSMRSIFEPPSTCCRLAQPANASKGMAFIFSDRRTRSSDLQPLKQ